MALSRTRSEPTWCRIAAATGLRMPSEASSTATALRPKAKPMMFWRMIRTVARASSTRPGRFRSGSPRMIRSPASAARSEPMPPRAIPASAWASAGASLMPSPTMATFRPASCCSLIHAALSMGESSACTVLTWTFFATRRAAGSRSPVSTATWPILRCFRSWITSWASGRTVSRSPITPMIDPSTATRRGVSPWSSIDASQGSAVSSIETPCSASSLRLPTRTCLGPPSGASTRAWTPEPGSAVASETFAGSIPRLAASVATATASGWRLACSAAAASLRTSASSCPGAAISRENSGLPRVSVPVLSKAKVSQAASRSSA